MQLRDFLKHSSVSCCFGRVKVIWKKLLRLVLTTRWYFLLRWKNIPVLYKTSGILSLDFLERLIAQVQILSTSWLNCFTFTPQIMSSCICVTRSALLHTCDIFQHCSSKTRVYYCSSDPHLNSPSCLISLTGALSAPWAAWSTIGLQKRAPSCSAASTGCRRTSVNPGPLGASRSQPFTTPPCKEVCHG